MNRRNNRRVKNGDVARAGDAHGGGLIGPGSRLLPNLAFRPGDGEEAVDTARLLADLERLQAIGRRASST